MTTPTQQRAAGAGQPQVSGIEVRCPADGRLVGTAPESGRAGVAEASQRLRSAQPEWEELGPAGRAGPLLAFLDWILDHEAHLVGSSRKRPASRGATRQ